MIQEKDFLYRVPVKTAPITTPRGQIRNPEILVDLEGGEFMHGNILDANSTNKLINQSVKDAVDDKFIESGHVTKDLLEAETSARTKGDEDLSSKIKAEQTRAEGKEKEISDKLAIVDGDSNTEGSFRKAIADVIAAAPEDLDTLKEIADKLAGNDDLHTALNQAITEKADASALANEVTRATGAESGLQAAIATKADATALSNYVLTTALNQQVDTLNTAISAKQDAGSYIPYDSTDTVYYKIDRSLKITENGYTGTISPSQILLQKDDNNLVKISSDGMHLKKDGSDFIDIEQSRLMYTTNRGNVFIGQTSAGFQLNLTDEGNGCYAVISGYEIYVKDGVALTNKGIVFNPGSSSPTYIYNKADDTLGARNIIGSKVSDAYGNLRDGINKVQQKVTANTTAIEGKQDKGNYALKTELPTVPTKTSQLTNDSNFIAANHVSDTYIGLEKDLKIYSEDIGEIMTISHHDVRFEANDLDFAINKNGFFISDDNSGEYICSFTPSGIRFKDKTNKDIPTAGGGFIKLSDLASADDVSSLRVGLSKKQNTITVNEVDITDIETADITKLRTIVTNLINALSASNLIMETQNIK